MATLPLGRLEDFMAGAWPGMITLRGADRIIPGGDMGDPSSRLLPACLLKIQGARACACTCACTCALGFELGLQ